MGNKCFLYKQTRLARDKREGEAGYVTLADSRHFSEINYFMLNTLHLKQKTGRHPITSCYEGVKEQSVQHYMYYCMSIYLTAIL